MTRIPISSPQTETTEHRSLALPALCDQLRDFDSCAILDLGPARAVNIEFWSRFAPRLFIGDLHSGLPQTQSAESEAVPDCWRALLNIPEKSTFDVILAWDLLNYLEQPAIASLVDFLSPFCRKGTLLFALIFDIPQIPLKPTVFKILDQDKMLYETRGPELRPCPRHQPRDIQRIMKRFVTSGSYRLRHGVQEYLFSFDPGAPTALS